MKDTFADGSPAYRPNQKILEKHIERACTDFLALDGWRCLKTDPVSRREWGKGFGEKGMADCLYIRYGLCVEVGSESEGWKQRHLRMPAAEVLWIEWKSPTGKTSTNQVLWHGAERARGALTWIAGIDFEAGYDSFVAFYRTSGLLRRQGL